MMIPLCKMDYNIFITFYSKDQLPNNSRGEKGVLSNKTFYDSRAIIKKVSASDNAEVRINIKF